MMRPHLSATMYCWVARVIRNAPFRWTFMTVSQSDSLILNSRLSRVTPALLTSTVGSPRSTATFSTAALTRSALETSAPTAIALPPASSLSPTARAASSSVRAVPAPALLGEVEHRHGHPGGCETLGGPRADAAGGPGHDRDSLWHNVCFPF